LVLCAFLGHVARHWSDRVSAVRAAWFHLVRAAGKRLGLITLSARSSWLPHVAYIAGALGTFMFTEHFMWIGLIAGGAAVWQRVKGRAVQPFGLAIIGLLVSVLCAAYWLSAESH
jgi:hypothetical protein